MQEETKPLLQRLRETGRDLEHTLAADRIEVLEDAMRQIIGAHSRELGAHGIYVAQRIAKIAMGIKVKKAPSFD